MGIDVTRAHHIAFGLGTAVAGVAGGLIVIYYPAQPFAGVEFIIVMYAGVVLGGMGSIVGAFWGGLVIGLVQQLSTVLVLVLGWLALGFIVQNSYFRLVLTLVPIWATFGISWDIFSGYSGLTSFGHAAFFTDLAKAGLIGQLVIPGLDPGIQDVERALAATWTHRSSPWVTGTEFANRLT